MSELAIKYRKTAELIPYARNARTHSQEQVEQIAASITEFGFTNPVLIDENDGIIAGHGRVMAAGFLQMDEVPTITLTGLSETQKRAYIIADNKLALNAGWDLDMLRLELQELGELDFNIDIIGFNQDELDKILNVEPGEEVFDQGGDNSAQSVQMEYLAFGKYKIPISTDELEQLETKLEQYTDNYGGTFGFATYLLGGE